MHSLEIPTEKLRDIVSWMINFELSELDRYTKEIPILNKLNKRIHDLDSNDKYLKILVKEEKKSVIQLRKLR